MCLLKKSLYGLKQSPQMWYLKFDEYLIRYGFISNRYDNCVYILKMGKICKIPVTILMQKALNLVPCHHKLMHSDLNSNYHIH